MTIFVFTIALIINNQRIITICAFKCDMGIDNFLMCYCNRQLLHALLLLTTFVCTITFDNFYMDYCNKGLSHTSEQH